MNEATMSQSMNKTDSRAKVDFYRASNIEAARIITADPERYPGLMQEWAALMLNSPAERELPVIGKPIEKEL